MKQSSPPRSDNSNQPTGTAGKAGIDNRADDVWLTTPEATAWLAEVAQSTEPVHRLTSRLRKQLSASQTHRVIELVDLRRRGANKFTAAESMFFTRQALEQATDQSIARYKAERFAGCELVADLCCGLGGDTAALAQVSRRVLACDRSEQVLDFAQRNLQAMLGDQVAEEGTQQVEWVASDVESLHLAEKGIDAWHIDPDRRPSGRRTVQVANHEPSEEAIEKLLSMVPHAAIKLSPACEPPAAWEAAGELEWISRGGECKQLVVWQGNLAREPGFRRATLLAAGDLEAEPRVVQTLVGDPETLRAVWRPSRAVPLRARPGPFGGRPHWLPVATAWAKNFRQHDRLPH